MHFLRQSERQSVANRASDVRTLLVAASVRNETGIRARTVEGQASGARQTSDLTLPYVRDMMSISNGGSHDERMV